MRHGTWIFGVLLLGCCAATVLAAPGGYDEKPWTADPVVGNAIVPEVEPNNACPGQPIMCGDVVSPASYDPTTDDDWYAFDVAVSGTLLTIGTQPYQGSSVDTYLELYDSCTGGRLTYDDDSGPNMFSLISNFPAPHAGTYYAKTFTYAHAYTGMYELFVNCTEPQPPPPNDQCSGAIPIDRCTNGVLTGDSFNAVDNYNPGIPGPSCTGYSAAGKDVVYLLSLEAGDVVHLTYTTPNSDASFYIVTDCANVSGTCVAGADQSYDVETINYTAASTGDYFVILDSYSTNWGGPWSLTYEIVCPGPVGVCCVGHTCILLHEFECANYQGHWHPEWTSCTPENPCDIYTPTDESSWGQIKNAYR